MRIRHAAVLIFLGALVTAPLVLAQVTDRYRVSSDPDAKDYPRSLVVVIASPTASASAHRRFVSSGRAPAGGLVSPRGRRTMPATLRFVLQAPARTGSLPAAFEAHRFGSGRRQL